MTSAPKRSASEATAGVRIARRRALAQHLAGGPCEDPAATVASLGAVQAQDYPGSLWAIGLRTRSATEEDVERAIADRSIVRTWMQRGTLHFVPAADVRWMLKLLAARPMSSAAGRHRQLGLDEAVFARSKDLLAKSLQGGRRLTRAVLFEVLRAGRVDTAGQRGIHVVQRLAQEGFLCYASREGRQQTFALLEEWVPEGRTLLREEALAELGVRYFTGHGPATLQDFAWWSGLAAADVREGLELARPRLTRDVVAGREHWSGTTVRARARSSPGASLLPAFDEFLVGFRDRSAMLDPAYEPRLRHLLSPIIVVDGRVVGTWTRVREREEVRVRTSFFERATAARTRLLAAAETYGRFLGRRVVIG